MSVRVLIRCVTALLLVCAGATGASAQEAIGAREVDQDNILDRIEAVYGRLAGVAVELRSIEQSPWSRNVVVAWDGRYIAIDNDDSGSAVYDTTYSAVDEKYAYQTGMAGIEKNELAKFPHLRIWWAYQLDAPWPMVASWVHALRGKNDVTIARSANLLTITSEDEQLSMTFDVETLALTRIGQVGGMDKFFEGFDNRVPPIPTFVRDVYDLPAWGNNPARHVDDTLKYATLELNPPDLAERVQFDPAALGLNEYDPKSGNVYDPDGKRLYNHKDYAEKMIAEAYRQTEGKAQRVGWSLGRWIMVGGATLLVLVGGVAVWQRRG